MPHLSLGVARRQLKRLAQSLNQSSGRGQGWDFVDGLSDPGGEQICSRVIENEALSVFFDQTDQGREAVEAFSDLSTSALAFVGAAKL